MYFEAMLTQACDAGSSKHFFRFKFIGDSMRNVCKGNLRFRFFQQATFVGIVYKFIFNSTRRIRPIIQVGPYACSENREAKIFQNRIFLIVILRYLII
jgi:hypothetical protein